MDGLPKLLVKFALMGAALAFIGHKLSVAVAEGRIRGRRHTYDAVEDPLAFDIYTAMYAVFALVILGMVIFELWKAAQE
jgi:hypothetical protein